MTTRPVLGTCQPVFRDQTDPTYVALLKAVRTGKEALDAEPRVDMPGAVPVPQQRDFGRIY